MGIAFATSNFPCSIFLSRDVLYLSLHLLQLPLDMDTALQEDKYQLKTATRSRIDS